MKIKNSTYKMNFMGLVLMKVALIIKKTLINLNKINLKNSKIKKLIINLRIFANKFKF